MVIHGTDFPEVIPFPKIRVQIDPGSDNEENTLPDALNIAHITARNTIERGLQIAFEKQRRERKLGCVPGTDLMGHDWCRARLLGDRRTSEETLTDFHGFVKTWRTMR